MSMFSLKKIIAVGFTCSLVASASAAGLDQADSIFMRAATQSGELEIQTSKLAPQRAASPEVKAFAQQMVTDHTKIANDLKTLAQSKNFKISDELSADQLGEVSRLEKMQGTVFDKIYAREIGVAAHQEAVALFDKTANNAKDADVKAFAAKTLPTLKEHLSMAEHMHSIVEKEQ